MIEPPDLRNYVFVCGTALAVTFALTPVARWLAVRWGAVVRPDERRVHTRPTPTLGGLAMLGGVLAAIGVASLIPDFDAVFAEGNQMAGVIAAVLVIYVVGMIDDLREVSAPAKIAGMVLAGGILSLVGIGIFFFRVPFADFYVLSPDLSALVSVLWVIGMCNAVNLIDGLDGLAAGIVAIAGFSLFLYGERLGDNPVRLLDADNVGPLLAAITFGVCLGFLPHNFHPAKVFMGDGGALLLGLLMAASTMAVGGQTDDPFSGQAFFFFAPLFIPFFILGVPILDTLFAIVRRASRRSGVTSADKEHLHHRLMRLGHGQRRSVVILWAWSALLSAVVLVPVYSGEGDSVVPLVVPALGLALYTLFHPGVRARRRDQLDDSQQENGGPNGEDAGDQPAVLPAGHADP